MANPRAFENGKATRFRSGKEAAKKGAEGGKASGEARAAFKSLKEDLKARCTPERVEKMNNTLLLMAERGNLRAYEIIQRSLGEDPEIEIKRAELKLRKAEAERKHPVQDTGPTVLEEMVKERYERPDEEAEAVSD